MTHHLEIGKAVPRRNSLVLNWIGRSALWLSGWKLNLVIPDEPKLIMIVAPHTSNWDFVLCMLSMGTTKIDIHWLGKNTLFRGPWGPALRWLGGIAVDRGSASGLVRQTVRTYADRDKLVIAITPEGTRGRVKQWKRGFYHIAENGQIPALPIAIDYKHKTVTSGPLLRATGDWDADMKPVFDFFRGVTAKYPELVTLD